MTKSTTGLIEPFTLNEDEMMVIVAITKSIRIYSKNKSISDLTQHLTLEEILSKGNDSKQLLWKKPMIDLIKKVEKKFSGRLKELKKKNLL